MSFEENLTRLVGLPESDRLQYEALLPSSGELGRLISAFSNTEGGVLILGILSKNGTISITGLSADFQVEVVLNNALGKLSPAPLVHHGFISHQGKKLFALEVEKADQRVKYSNVTYGIVFKKVRKLTELMQPIGDKELPMGTTQALDEILKYLIANPGLINVNKHMIRETILNYQVSLDDANDLLERLKVSGYVKTYGTRFIGYSLETRAFINNGGYSKNLNNSAIKINMKSIFISYNWGNKLAASNLYNFLVTQGFSPSMDDHNLSYKGRISTFMESIRAADYAVLIISDDYLKSENCMTEVMHVLKDRNYHDKILPIRHENVKIFKPADRLRYIEYWQNQVQEREIMLASINPTDALEEFRRLRIAKQILSDIGDFLSDVADLMTYTVEDLEYSSYKDIIKFIDA